MLCKCIASTALVLALLVAVLPSSSSAAPPIRPLEAVCCKCIGVIQGMELVMACKCTFTLGADICIIDSTGCITQGSCTG